MNEYQWVIDILIGVILLGGGWFARMVWTTIQTMQKSSADTAKAMQKEISDLQVHIAEDYAKKDDVASAIGKVEVWFGKVYEKLDKVFDKLDQKADK